MQFMNKPQYVSSANQGEFHSAICVQDLEKSEPSGSS
jgi:hypothetical protein